MAGRIVAFYDGGCPRCRRLATRYGALDSEARIRWCDLTASRSELNAAGIDPGAALRKLHVIDEEGKVQSGASALTVIWRALPRRRNLARLARIPLLSFLIDRGYDVVARHRSRQVGGVASDDAGDDARRPDRD